MVKFTLISDNFSSHVDWLSSMLVLGEEENVAALFPEATKLDFA